MRNYRDKFDIIADILKIAKRNPKKTQIMYQANLSYTVLKKYLSEIIEASLISHKKEGQYYELTDKGRRFLDFYKEYSKANSLMLKQAKNANLKKEILKKLCV